MPAHRTTRRTARTTAAVATAAAGALALVPSAASADVRADVDALHDVWVLTGAPDSQQDVEAAPDVVDDVALIGSTVRHGGRRVTLTAHYQALDSAEKDPAVVFRLRTDTGRRFSVQVITSTGNEDGTATLSRLSDHEVLCVSSVTHTVDYDADLIRIRVPNRCLGKPASVRWRGSSYLFEGEQTWVDDMLSPDATSKGVWSRAVTRG